MRGNENPSALGGSINNATGRVRTFQWQLVLVAESRGKVGRFFNLSVFNLYGRAFRVSEGVLTRPLGAAALW